MKRYRLKPRFYVITLILMVTVTVLAINHINRVCKPAVTTYKCINPNLVEVIKPVEEPESLGEFRLTAYCGCSKCCGIYGENREGEVRGSTGEILKSGYSIAVDPDVIPYGTKVNIGGVTYEAQDTGGAIKGNRIDIYFETHEEALEFGVQHSEVFKEA